jgi:hypothetical protein
MRQTTQPQFWQGWTRVQVDGGLSIAVQAGRFRVSEEYPEQRVNQAR